MIGRLRFIILTLLLIVVVSPVFAQSAPALTQSVKLTTDNGLTLTTSYPADWSGASDDRSVFVASSAQAVDEIKSGGTIKTPGMTGIIVYSPNFLDNVHLPYDAPPIQALNAYLQGTHMSGSSQASSDFSVPAATVPLTDTPTGLKGILGALGFPDGTVVGQVWQCSLTMALATPRGQITIEGVYYDTRDSELASTGGIDAFEGVRGQVTRHATTPDRSEY